MQTEVPAWRSYHRLTRTATYSILSVIPLLLLYEILIVLVNSGSSVGVRVSSDVWVKQFPALFGEKGVLVVGAMLAVVGVLVFVHDRKKGVRIRPRFLGFMIAESSVYAVVVALLVSSTVAFLFSGVLPLMALSGSPDGYVTRLALSLGAGLYEELVFRVILVGGLFWIFNALSDKKRAKLAYVLAALIGATLFSAVHYVGSLGDAFTLSSFVFRFLFGLVLNVIFLVRGFGVAAWTHAIYDVLVVSHLLG